MPFACIAVIAIAIIWLMWLTIVQVVSGPRRDPISALPVPPRAMVGNGVWPVLGHTILFHKYGGDMGWLFPPDWKEWRFCSRLLGETFSVFVWGQWNVVVKGHERVRRVIESADVSEGWPYGTPPVTLLGKSCLALLDEEEAGCMRHSISDPLSHSAVVKQAPQFAELAQKCLDAIIGGHFNPPHTLEKNTTTKDENPFEDPLNTSDSHSSDGGDRSHKVKLDALRSFTYDLVDGPVLNLKQLSTRSSSSPKLEQLEEGSERSVHSEKPKEIVTQNETKNIDRQKMLLWMDRLKQGLCDIKFTWGPEWMQIWRLNSYGRALHARKRLEKNLGSHVDERSKLVSVLHEKGRATRDPFTSTFALLKLTEHYFFRKNEHVVFGRKKSSTEPSRQRAQSEPELAHSDDDDELRPMKGNFTGVVPSNLRARAVSEPDVTDVPLTFPKSDRPTSKRLKVESVLDQVLSQGDYEGQGMTKVAATEISLLLWMMLDAGSAWTAMALHLLAKNEDACSIVQSELDRLEQQYGKERLFTSFVLGKMEKLDNLIYESMRITPPFLGGMKTVNQTVELDDVQIPKNTSVILCNAHDEESFTLDYDTPKHPEEMGMFYPHRDLYGFLPLQGLEIPLMVLQSKVFLIVLLQNCSPVKSKRRTFIRKVQDAIQNSVRHIRTPSQVSSAGNMGNDASVDVEMGRVSQRTALSIKEPSITLESTPSQVVAPRDGRRHILHEERLFSNVSFPELRRAVVVQLRADRELHEDLPSKPTKRKLFPRISARIEKRKQAKAEQAETNKQALVRRN